MEQVLLSQISAWEIEKLDTHTKKVLGETFESLFKRVFPTSIPRILWLVSLSNSQKQGSHKKVYTALLQKLDQHITAVCTFQLHFKMCTLKYTGRKDSKRLRHQTQQNMLGF